jgi:hypothetical protein
VEIPARLGVRDRVETMFKICEDLAANPERGVQTTEGDTI